MSTSPSKTGRGRKIAIGCGGCAGIVGLILIIIVIVSIATGGGSGDDPTPSSTQSASSEAPAKKTEKPTEQSSEAETPSKTEKAEDSQKWADGVADYVIEQNAGKGKKWADVCGGTGWCAYVQGVSADNVGDLKVTLQVTPDAAENEELARSTASFIVLSAFDEHPELKWVEVYDGTGVIIDQYQPSDFGK